MIYKKGLKKINIEDIVRKYHNLPITVKVTIWFMICNIIQKAISIITVPIFTRILTTTEYGQFSIYNSWLQVFTIVSTFRLDYAVFNKGMSKFPKRRDEYTSSMQGLTATLTTGALIVYLIFRNQFNALTEMSTFITLAIFLELYFTPAISFWSLRKRYDFKYKAVVSVTLAMAIANPIIGLIAVNISKDKGTARIMSCILIQICFGLYFFILNLVKGKKIYSKEFWKFAVLFNLPLIPHYFSSYILEQSDRIMIQKMCGIEMVALYSVAYNAGAIIKIVTNSLNNAIIPWQYRKLENLELDDLKRNTFQCMVFVAGCIMTFSLFAPEFMHVLAGKEYQQAVYVIPPIAGSVFFVFMYGIYANVEFFFDANKFAAIISLFGAVLNLLLNFIFISIFGYIAAGYTSLACYVVFSFLHAFYVRSIVKQKTHREFFDFRIIALSAAVILLTSIISLSYLNTIVRYGMIVVFIILACYNRKRIVGIIRSFRETN